MTPHRLDFGHLDADDVDHRDELVDVVADEIVSEGGVLMLDGRTSSRPHSFITCTRLCVWQLPPN